MITGSLIRKRIMACCISLYYITGEYHPHISAARTSYPRINWALRTQPSNIVHCCLRPNHGRRLFGGIMREKIPVQHKDVVDIGILGCWIQPKKQTNKGVKFLILSGSMFCFLLFWKVNKLELVSLKLKSFERCETMGFSLHQCCIKSMLC